MRKISVLFLLAAVAGLSACEPGAGIDRVEASLRQDKQTTNVFYVFRDPKVAVLMDTDTDGDGKLDQRSWIKHYPGDDSKFQAFYQEAEAENQRERIWYGPDNLRLISKEDLNGDGRFEQTVYYNRGAFSTTSENIIARVELDLDGDERSEVWFFPPIRLEVDSNGDGRPDRIIAEPAAATRHYTQIVEKRSIEGINAGAAGLSWAMNPSAIPVDRYRATMNSLSK